MADADVSGALISHWEQAFDRLDRWLLTSFVGVTQLGATELSAYPGRAFKAGWRLSVAFSSGDRRLDVLVGDDFPFAAPRLALVDRPAHLTWPHLESDGCICLLPNNATVDFEDCVAVLIRLLADAVNWLEDCEAGVNIDDFRAEFSSYWSADAGAPAVRSLLAPEGPSRPIFLHGANGALVVADNEDFLARWLANARPDGPQPPRKFDLGFFIWMEQPLIPTEYPITAMDVTGLIEKAGLGVKFRSLAAEQQSTIVVVMGASTVNGPALAAVVLRPASTRGKPGGPGRAFGGVERGFRPGKAPPALVAKRFLASTRVTRATVERLDLNWVHGRDSDPDVPRLLTSKVTIVGCGAIGGPIALALAQAGVGTLHLIDPERLRAANVGRHPLGVDQIGSFKAEALARRIKRQYPHIVEAIGHPKRWEDIARDQPTILAEADLVISTIGGWSTEGALNAWRWDRRQRPDFIFGWTEPHAVAGHAVGLIGGVGCLSCGLSSWGEPLQAVAAWPNGPGAKGEPACGVMYQPYGSVQAAHITALISEAAMDVLLQRVSVPFHRTWIARESVMTGAGATVSQGWRDACGGTTCVACVVERDWLPRPGCSICGMASPR